MQRFLRQVAKHLQRARLSTLLLVMAGGIGGPLMIFPESRSSESHENAPPSERQEEFTTMGRLDHERLMKLEQRRLAIILKFLLRTWATRKMPCCSPRAAIALPMAF